MVGRRDALPAPGTGKSPERTSCEVHSMKESTELRATRIVFFVSFLITTVLIALLAITQPLRSNIKAGFLWGTVLVLGMIAINSRRGSRRWLLRFLLVIAIINLLIVPPEVYLRYIGYRYEPNIEFGYPRPYQISAEERNAKLFWTFPRSWAEVNSYGFVGAEPVIPKPTGSYRILFLGNICTYGGLPAMVEFLLREKYPSVECLNFAAPGYSSYQGKVFSRSYLKTLAPDLLVVSYGWNDRWLAYGEPDEDKRIDAGHSEHGGLSRRIYYRWRLLQVCRKALAPVLGEAKPLDVPRVSLDKFMENLESIGSQAEELGIPVIFATEPSSHPSVGVPDQFVTSKYAKSKEASLALFKEYNDAVRAVAGERNNWHLIDLDKAISSRRDVRALFEGDGMRYSRLGMALVSNIEARYIAEHFVTSRGE
jgi:hypothetical protein